MAHHKVERFSESSIVRADSFRVAFISPSTAGKTTLINYLLWSCLYKQYKYVYLLIGSPSSSYEGFVWPNCKWIIKNKEDVDRVIDKIINFSTKINNISKELNKRNITIGHKSLVILDDVSDHLRKSSKIDQLFSWGRNAGVSIICLLQRFTQLNTICRQNITHIMMFQNSQETIECLLKETPVQKFSLKDIIKILNDIFTAKRQYQSVCISIYETKLFPITLLEASSDFVDGIGKHNILDKFYSPFMFIEESDDIFVVY